MKPKCYRDEIVLSQRRKRVSKQRDKRIFPTNTLKFDAGNMTTKNAR